MSTVVQLPNSKPSLYARFMAEREGAHTVEMPWGFATYKVGRDNIYLETVYVKPEERQNGRGVELMKIVEAKAKQKQLPLLYGSVDPRAEFSTQMMQIMFKLGFKLSHSEPNLIYLVKKVE